MWQQSSHQSCPVCWLHCSALRSDLAPRPGTVDLGPGLRRRTLLPPIPAASWPAESRWDCRESASSHSDRQHSDPSSPTEHQTGFHRKPSETPQLLGLKRRGKFCILTNLQVQTVEVMWPTDDFTLKVMKNDITMTSWGLFRQTWDTQDVTNWLVSTWTWVGRWARPCSHLSGPRQMIGCSAPHCGLPPPSGTELQVWDPGRSTVDCWTGLAVSPAASRHFCTRRAHNTQSLPPVETSGRTDCWCCWP